MICFIMLLLYSLDKVFVSFPLVMLWYFYLSVFLRYTLFAVVNHSGTLEVGHYTCFIRQQQQVCSLIASRCFTIIFNRNLSNPRLHWFAFASLCDWFRKLAPLSTNRMVKWNQSRLGRPRFPRFGQFACSYSEFSLALNEFSFFLIGCWDYLGFGFTTVNRKLL